MPKTHTVKEGDSMLSIAHDYNFTRWEAIYYHESNANFRRERPDPMFLMAGDVVNIPDYGERREICETGKTHVFQLTEPLKTHLSLVLQESENTFYANKKYTVEIEGEKTIHGMTSLEGELKEEVPVAAKEAKVTLWAYDNEDPLVYNVNIGHMDPVETDTGVQDRLINMGYDLGDEYGEIGEKTREAIKLFQQLNGLDPADGELNDATRNQIDLVSKG